MDNKTGCKSLGMQSSFVNGLEVHSPMEGKQKELYIVKQRSFPGNDMCLGLFPKVISYALLLKGALCGEKHSSCGD